MEMNKKLLSVAVSTAMLAACGGSSSGSSTPADPAPVVLTSEQKLDAGKEFVAKFDDTVIQMATGAGSVVHNVLDETNGADQEGKDSGEYQLKAGVQLTVASYSQILELLRIFNEDLAADEPFIKIGESFTLEKFFEPREKEAKQPMMGPSSELTGSVVVNKTGDRHTFEFDLNFAPEAGAEQPALPATSIKLSVSQLEKAYSSFIQGDPANRQFETAVSGTISNSEASVTLTDVTTEAVYADYYMGPGYPMPSRGVAMYGSSSVSLKSLTMDMAGISVTVGNLEASAAVTLKLRQPLQTMDDMYYEARCCGPYGGALYYDNYGGSVGALAGPLSDYLAYATPQNSVNPETLSEGIYATNLVELNITDLSLTDGSGNTVSGGAVVLTGTNADTYRLNGGHYADGEFEFAEYTINEEADTLTIENKFGSAVYTFEADDSYYGGTISCEKDYTHSEAYGGMVGLHSYDTGLACGDKEDLYYSAANITEWVESIQENHNPRVTLDRTLYQVKFVDGDIVNKYYIHGRNGNPLESEMYPLMLKAEVAATVDFAAQGDVDPEATPVAISMTHSGLDQNLEFSIGAGLMTGSYATYAPVLEVNSKVEEQGGLFDAQFNIDRMASKDAYKKLDSEELTEAEQKQLDEIGYVRFKAGDVTIDGEVVAEIQFLIGPGINQDNNPTFAYDSEAYRLVFSDGSAPNGEVFTTVEEFATVCVPAAPESGEGEKSQPLMSECTPTPVQETGVFSFKTVFSAFYGSVGAYEDMLPIGNPFPSEDAPK